jgi:hypothetical protein
MSNMSAARKITSTLAISIATIAFAAIPACTQEKDGAGAVVSGRASAKDVGLPIYPGSKPHKDNERDSEAANLGLWGGGAGFRLVVLKMESSDAPEKVAAFYRKALFKYGNVLDCTNPPAPGKTDRDDSTKVLTCGDDKPEKGGLLYKAGTKEKQHIVSIQPNGQGTLYQLVNVGSWGNK